LELIKKLEASGDTRVQDWRIYVSSGITGASPINATGAAATGSVVTTIVTPTPPMGANVTDALVTSTGPMADVKAGDTIIMAGVYAGEMGVMAGVKPNALGTAKVSSFAVGAAGDVVTAAPMGAAVTGAPPMDGGDKTGRFDW
jgi:hypothetical protein